MDTEPSIEVLRFYASSPTNNQMRKVARFLLALHRKQERKEKK